MPTGLHAILCWLALLLAVSCGEAPSRSRESGGAGPAVLRLQLSWTDDAEKRRRSALGTGFVVSARGHVITAQHVVANGRERLADLENTQRAKLVAALPTWMGVNASSAEERPVEVDLSVLAEYPEVDLALLKFSADPLADGVDALAREVLDGSGERGIAQLSLDTPKHGAAVVLSGYPHGQKQLSVSSGNLIDLPTLHGVVVRDEPSAGWMANLLTRGAHFADVDTRPGHSGGPVSLADSGGVIGVCSSVMLASKGGIGRDPLRFPLRYRSEITVVIPTAEIVEILHAHGIPWQESE